MGTITLNSNIAALNAQRRLGESTRSLNESFTRLSSGLRINRAVDDAAGLAIAEELKTNSRIFNQGVRNLNDGISLLGIADAAIENLSSITVRLQELAEQAANGVNSYQQRKALDAEAQALTKEFSRITKTTNFNGLSLFDGSVQQLSFQAGLSTLNLNLGGNLGDGTFTAQSSFAVGGTSVIANALSDLNGDGKLDLVSVGSGGTGLISIQLGDGSGGFALSQSLSAPSANFNSVSVADLNGDGIMDLVAGEQGAGSYFRTYLGAGNGTFSFVASYSAGSLGDLESGDFNGDGKMDLFVATNTSVALYQGLGNGQFSAFSSIDPSFTNVNDVTVTDINRDGILDFGTGGSGGYDIYLGAGDGNFTRSQSVATGTILAMSFGDFDGDGTLDLLAGAAGGYGTARGNGDGTFTTPVVSVTGANQTETALADLNGDGIAEQVLINSSFITIRTKDGSGGYTLSGIYTGGNTFAVGDVNSDGVLDLVSGGGSTPGSAQTLIGNSRYGINPIVPFSLGTLADAKSALSLLGAKRDQLAKQRGQIGAYQSRIQVAANVLDLAGENLRDAESRIRDADVAIEAASLTRLNILQKGAAAVLAQAAQQPSLALRLLERP